MRSFFSSKGVVGLKVISHKLPDFDELKILPLADLHLGDPHSDFKKILSWIEYIQSNDNVYTIMNGDLMNIAIKSSVSDIYGEKLQPMEQLRQCVKIFGPIADKILCCTSGNHENRIWKQDGLDLTQIMCNQLGIGDLYSPASALLFVRFGRTSGDTHNRPQCYTIFCLHGSGSGRTEGAKVNRLVQLANICDADIYLHSHTHMPAILKNSFYRVNISNSSVQKVDKLFINTSAALDWGGYGEVQAFKPTSTETPIICLNGRKRGMKAIL